MFFQSVSIKIRGIRVGVVLAPNHGGTSHWGEASAAPAVLALATESSDEDESYWPISYLALDMGKASKYLMRPHLGSDCMVIKSDNLTLKISDGVSISSRREQMAVNLRMPLFDLSLYL